MLLNTTYCILDYIADEWPQHNKFTFPRHLFSYFDFVVLYDCDMYSQFCYDFILLNDRRSFSSLNLDITVQHDNLNMIN